MSGLKSFFKIYYNQQMTKQWNYLSLFGKVIQKNNGVHIFCTQFNRFDLINGWIKMKTDLKFKSYHSSYIVYMIPDNVVHFLIWVIFG